MLVDLVGLVLSMFDKVCKIKKPLRTPAFPAFFIFQKKNPTVADFALRKCQVYGVEEENKTTIIHLPLYLFHLQKQVYLCIQFRI